MTRQLRPYVVLLGLAIILGAISAWRLLGPGRDVIGGYDQVFQWARELTGISQLPAFRYLDLGFAFLLYLIAKLPGSSDAVFLLLIGVLTASLKLACFKRYAPNFVVALLADLALFYVVHDYTQLRAGLAIATMMVATGLFVAEQRRALGGLVATGAIGFHLSSAIMIPFIAARAAPTGWLIGFIGLALLSGAGLDLVAQLDTRVAGYVSYAETYTRPNPISSIKVFQYVSVILFFVYRKRIRSRGWTMVETAGWFLVVGLAFFAGLYRVPVLANRVSELFTSFMPFLISGLALLMPPRWAVAYVAASVVIGCWGSYWILK